MSRIEQIFLLKKFLQYRLILLQQKLTRKRLLIPIQMHRLILILLHRVRNLHHHILPYLNPIILELTLNRPNLPFELIYLIFLLIVRSDDVLALFLSFFVVGAVTWDWLVDCWRVEEVELVEELVADLVF